MSSRVFLFKLKQNQLFLTLQSEDSDEKVAELVEKLQVYDPNGETLTIEEARDLVKRSGMLLLPGWDLSSSFMLDQIRRQEKSISFEAFGPRGLQRGSGYNIDAQSLAVWSIAPELDKPKQMEVKDTPQGNVIFWSVQSTHVK